MTPEQQIVVLQRQVRELQEELAEYERQGRGPALGLERVVQARRRLRVGRPQVHLIAARTILFLADRPGRTVEWDVLLSGIVVDKAPEACSRQLQQVAVSHARAALRPHGLAIETVWGVGCRMPATDAAAVKALIGEAGA